MKISFKRKIMKQGLESLINAVYIKREILSLLKENNLKNLCKRECFCAINIWEKDWKTTITHNNVYKNKQICSSIKACSPFRFYCKLKNLSFGIAYLSYT